MTTEFENLALLLLALLVIVSIVQLVFAVILFRYMKRIAGALGTMREGAAPGSEGAGVIPGGWGPSGLSREPPGGRGPSGPGKGPLWSGTPVPRAPEPGVPETKAEPLRPRPAVAAAPVKAEILKDRRDIQGSAQSLSQKYELTDYLIATLDGLVVVSLHPGSSDEAARYSDLYRRKKKPDTPGVTFLGIRHRGEPMLVAMKSDRPLGPEELKGIGEDSEKILNWWL